jgi:hypothetical protein
MTEEEIWQEDDSTPQGMFLLMKGAIIDGSEHQENIDRCDVDSIGPVGLNYQPGDGTFLGTTRFPHSVRPVDEQLKEFARVISYHPLFFIMYVSRGNKDVNDVWTIDPAAHYYQDTKAFVSDTGAHTIGGFFRLIWEWAQIYEAPFNERHVCAIYSKKVFETLPFTPEIIAEIETMPNQTVFRFLSGEEDVNVYERNPGPYPLSPTFRKWIREMQEKFHPSNIEWLSEV